MAPRASLNDNVTFEFAAARLGDERRSKRLLEIVSALDARPSAGFPQALGSEAQLEGFYRFINNEDFAVADVLEPHIAATFERARRASRVVAVHDTSSIEYPTPAPREGLGFTTASGRQGYLAHISLLMSTDGLPLGVAHLETYTRSGKKRRGQTKSHKVAQDPNRESLRWVRGVRAIDDAREEHGFDVIHVTDAEGDFFELIAGLNEDDTSFVIRAGQLDRRVMVGDVETRLRDVVDQVPARAMRRVELSERPDGRERPRNNLKRHPPRRQRETDLVVGTTKVTLIKTKFSDFDTVPFEVNVVRVWEQSPVAGEPAVEWVLFTSEDVSTKAKLLAVVDIYRLRWTIEEFFKALKSGCALEKRQVESYAALAKVLALFVPIAYRLLLIRGLQRLAPEAKITHAFSSTEIHLMCKAPSNRGLAPPTSIADGLVHLARLGGHLKRNGPPGWSTLGRGYEALLLLRMGWELALNAFGRSDQS